MDKPTNKSYVSSISTTGTTTVSPPFSDTVDNVKYMNLNFVDNSESSSQAKDAMLEFQKMQNHNFDQQQKSVKPPPSKILPTSLPLPSKKNDTTVQLTEVNLKCKSLIEMGFKPNEVDGWENIVQPPKESLYKLLKKMIDNHIKPNVQIRIGSVTFNCHMMVLQCYSDFFMECNNEVLIQLPEEKITPGAFMMVYDWMLAEEPLVQREGILELFNAANFLRIKDLINQCWLCLDDDVRFREDTAFLLYLEARKYGLESLEQLMLMRICKFFLTLVASKEFLALTSKEIITLLSSNTIGVNSEIEVFMAVVRWLNYDWEEREQYMLDIIKTVRFSLMPPWFLVTLTKTTDCVEIDRIAGHPEVKKMLNDGISFTTTQLYYGDNREEFVHFLERYQLVVPMQRQWVYDNECNYHHRLECPNMQHITYKSFLEYLEMIQTIGKDYWRNLEMTKTHDNGMPCCVRSDGRKTVEANLKVLRRRKSRDQGIQCENGILSHRRSNMSSRVNKAQSKHGSTAKAAYKRTPRGHPRYATSITSYCKTETEPALENNSQQYHPMPDETKCDFVQSIAKYESTGTNTTNNNVSALPKENGNKQRKQPQNHYQQHHQAHQHQHQHKHQHQHHHRQQQMTLVSQTKRATNNNHTVIFKNNASVGNDNGPEDTIQRNNDGSGGVDINAQVLLDDAGDAANTLNVLKMENEAEAAADVISCDNKRDLLHQQKIPKGMEWAQKLNSISDYKIILIGGIDPYCLHCQNEQQQQQQQQQQQIPNYELLMQPQQRKRMLTVDNLTPHTNIINNNFNTTTTATNITRTIYTANNNAFSTTTPTPNLNANNNKFQQLGDQVLLYDVRRMEWRHLSHIPLGSRHHHAAVLCNGLIYVIGGTKTALGCTKKSVFEKSVWCFNPNTLKWVLESTLPESRRDFAVIAINEETACVRCKESKDPRLHDIGFFIIGGEGINGTALSSVWFYSVRRKIWLKKAPLNTGRYGLAAAIVNNEIWIAGGIISDNNNNPNMAGGGDADKSAPKQIITDTIEIYSLKCTHEVGKGANGDDDSYAGRWIKSYLRLRRPRLFGKLCKMPNDDLFIVGGIGFNELGIPTSLSAIDHFNFEQHEWRHFADLKWARHGHDAAVINDYCIVVVGGVSTIKKHTLQKVEIFCTKLRKSLSDLPDLPFPLSGCAIVALTNKN